MSLSNLNASELEDLLMEETKKFTSAMRDGNVSQQEKDRIRDRINEILGILENRKHHNGSSSSVS